MLRGLHKTTANWLGRVITGVVVGLIAISFAIWGIGDIFRGFGLSTVAKIGNTEITVTQFRQTYNDRLQQLGRQIGRPITPDQARALGLDRRILGELLAEAAMDDNVRHLRLGLPDDEIAKRITADPSFRGPTGRFDRSRFEQIIRQFGYNEDRYVSEQRRVALRRQIVGTITEEIEIPNAFVDVRNRFDNEERRIEYVRLTLAHAGNIPSPTPEQLAKYFADRKTQFRAPEYRKLALLVLTPQEVAAKIEISDADAKREIDEHRDRYVTPEKREVQQIVFPNMEEARAARQRVGGGLTFQALAAERGLKESDFNLGAVVKSGIIDRAVADAAFAMKEGEVSEPVQGRFGATLLRVNKIVPELVRPAEELTREAKRNVALVRARAQIQELHDKIEDTRAGGLALSEVGKKLGLPVRIIDAIDRAGRGADGAPVKDVPQAADLVNGAFASDISVENDPLQSDNGFIWYDVIGVSPSRDRTIEEVKDRVEQGWRNEQIAERLKTKAGELLDKLKTQSLAEVAAANGLKAEIADKLKRNTPTPAIPARVLDQIFRTAKGEAGSAEAGQTSERVVFRVAEVAIPALDPNAEGTKQITAALKRSLGEDLLAEYISRLETDTGATINQEALRTAIGASGGSGGGGTY